MLLLFRQIITKIGEVMSPKSRKLKLLLTSFLLALCSMKQIAIAQSELDLSAAMSNSARPEADKARDAARRPEQVLEFIGIKPGMTVIDIIAGGGYYTELLAAAVADDGKVVSHNFEWGLQFRQGASAQAIKEKAERYPNIVKLVAELAPMQPPESLWSRVNPAPWPVDLGPYETDPEPYWGTLDAAFLGLNLHDAYIWDEDDQDSAVKLLSSIFRLLKPGGVLGVTEHRGMNGQDNHTLHRLTDEKAKQFLTEAGFVIEAESDILANPDDDHTKNIFDQSLGRNTDRMLIRARKPL